MSQPSGSKFVTDQKKGEFRASKFMGLDIYGSDNEKIGDIKEILVDAQGQAKAIVIGVGGFLGIGEKSIAIPWASVTWQNERPAARSAATTGDRPVTTGAGTPTTGASTTTGAPPAAGTATTGGAATTGTATTGAPVTTGTATTGGPAATTRSPEEQAAINGYPDHGRVQLTRAELNDAPTYRWYGDNQARSGDAPRPAGTPPRQ